MTQLALAGGTDVAEVALFSTDALPGRRKLNGEVLAELERAGTLVRFPTGSDGAYLLHLYVDEPIPPAIAARCVQDDSKNGSFLAASGAIAFGGVESAACDFKPNENIRSDGTIPAGRYEYAAFHTEFPEEMPSSRPKSSTNLTERIVVAMANFGPLIAFLPIVAALSLRQYVLAGVLFVAAWGTIRMCRRSAVFKRWLTERKKHGMQYPSIVVSLRSNPSIEATGHETR
jgi:hypothetical protein